MISFLLIWTDISCFYLSSYLKQNSIEEGNIYLKWKQSNNRNGVLTSLKKSKGAKKNLILKQLNNLNKKKTVLPLFHIYF